MDVRVRVATIDDADPICDVHLTAWRVAYRHMLSADVLDGDELETERRQRWRAWNHRRHFDGEMFVATIDERVVGFVHAGTELEREGFALPAGPRGEVFGFYAHPDVWGSAVAPSMMAVGLAEIADRGHDEAVVWTAAAADRARRFYGKAGFEPTGRTVEWTAPFLRGQSIPEVELRRPVTAADRRPDLRTD